MSPLTPVEDHLRTVLSALEPLAPVTLPLARAHGTVLAQDVRALLAVPPWTNSAMDGYALRRQDLGGAAPVVLPVSQDVPAGSVPTPLEPGTAARIMTGATLPAGADTVVRVEDTDQEPGPRPLPDQVTVRVLPQAGANVRHAGEDTVCGAPVLGRGTLLGARELAALASTGHGTVLVRPRPRVAVVSTGAELSEPGRPLAPGHVPDSNSLLLAGLLTEVGAHCAGTWRAADTSASLAEVLLQAAADADLVVTSGGVSAGAFDPLTMLAAQHQEPAGAATDGQSARVHLTFASLAMQPGKPQAHGHIDVRGRRVPLLALPGNPVSVLVSFTSLVRPALARLAGLQPPAPAAPPGYARAASAWSSPVGRRQHVPVRLVPAPAGHPGQEDTWVAPTHRLGSGSHLVASLPQAQALAVVDEEVPAVELGQPLRLLPLPAPARP